MTDTGLLRQVIGGDKNAYRQLFEQYFTVLYRHMFYQCQNESLAEDIAQETFVKVWSKRGGFKPGQPFLPLILKIAQNLLFDHFRKHTMRERLSDRVKEVNTPSNPSPDEEASARILEQRIRKIVNTSLPLKCRQVFILSRMEGLSYREIADCLGISRKTVENHLCRALKIIRKKGKRFL